MDQADYSGRRRQFSARSNFLGKPQSKFGALVVEIVLGKLLYCEARKQTGRVKKSESRLLRIVSFAFALSFSYPFSFSVAFRLLSRSLNRSISQMDESFVGVPTAGTTLRAGAAITFFDCSLTLFHAAHNQSTCFATSRKSTLPFRSSALYTTV